VSATDAGRALYPEAQAALAALRHAAAVVATHADEAPILRLAASHTIGGFLLPGWLSQFRASDARQTRIQVEIINSEAVLSRVRNGRVDIGFIESLDPTDGLDTVTAMSDEIVAVVASSHPWARRRTIPARRLLEDAYLSREPGSGTRAVAAAALAEIGVTLSPTIDTASTQSLKRAVVEEGFTLISRLTIDAELLTGTLCAVRVEGVDLSRPLRAVRRRRSSPDAVAQRFWRHLRHVAQNIE
jgi:DNA-binding transcriptional LysR family regulator